MDVKAGRLITYEQLTAELGTADVIYIGEEHRNRSHIEAALRILRTLLERGRLPTMALEMFGWDGQAGLDRYLVDPAASKGQLLLDAHWKQNWAGPYEDYEPFIGFAREHHVPVLALNPPKPLVRRVAREGLVRARSDPEMSRWGMREEPLDDEPVYRGLILKQLRSCHGGLSEDTYQRMYDAALFRDEGMAKIISNYLNHLTPGAGPLVSYTGGGHIQYGVPVPSRVLRRQHAPIRQTTIYLSALEPGHAEDVQDMIRKSIADYLWLTPLSASGPAPRCI